MELLNKKQIIDSLQDMPEVVEMEDVIERIIVLSKIERAKRQIEAGEFENHEKVKEKYKKWLN